MPVTLYKDDNREEFWLDNFKDLYINGNYLKFIPRYDTTRSEQLNAITRFSFYLIILLLLFNRESKLLYIPILTIVLCSIFYYINRSDKEGKQKELYKVLKTRNDIRNDKLAEDKRQVEHDGEQEYTVDIDTPPEEKGFEDLEGGYIDGDGVIRVGNKQNPPPYERNQNESLYTVDELIDYQRNTCRKPTNDNPFMNPAVTDFNNGEPPAACNVEDEEIQDQMMVHFNHNLFRDVDELWERENSQRQFYTLPNTGVPNNQTEFAKWLYNIPKTCKEDGAGCLRYEDLRRKRHDIVN